MKTLVTGGAGFIGSAVVPLLQKEGYDVFVLDNLSFGSRDFIDVNDDHFYLTDIRDKKAVEKAILEIQPDIVVHLAAIHFIPYCNQHPYEAADTNIRGTMNILDAIKQVKGLKKLFFASTAAVYPIYDEAVSEKHEQHPLDIYGLSKLTGEHLCSGFYLDTGIDTIVCRFFNAFGPNETNPHLIPEVEKQLREGLRTINLGNLTPKRDFIHTHDMANAVKTLLAQKDIGFDVFNLGRGIEYSVVEIVEAFARQLNEKVQINVDQARVRKVERQHLLADVTKLKKIGWEPVWGIDEGIKNLIDNWK
ncbi:MULTISPECIES: NAD-dependent epimerase/dehydratase family protein [unclassified Carboxylicivirga]|uniref:NAD-dependent epimerase/dehydratase family protein n=1 Tax=Carboxylicivirga TaxID=1628153 RepID=UPI003D34E585